MNHRKLNDDGCRLFLFQRR